MRNLEQERPDMLAVLRAEFPSSKHEQSYFGPMPNFFIDSFNFPGHGKINVELREIPFSLIIRNPEVESSIFVKPADRRIAERLGIRELEFERSFSETSAGLSLQIIERSPGDGEAMFLLALKFATPERPVEAVLETFEALATLGTQAAQEV